MDGWLDLYEFDEKGFVVDQDNKRGWHKLHLTIFHQDGITLQRLLNQGAPVDIRRRHYEMSTPLHEAVYTINVEAARILLDAKADVNALTYFRDKPFNVLPHNNRVKKLDQLVDLLLERNGDINHYGCESTPLDRAARHGDVDQVNLLLERKADIKSNLENIDTYTSEVVELIQAADKLADTVS